MNDPRISDSPVTAASPSRLTRRRLLGAIAAGTAGAILAACGEESAATATARPANTAAPTTAANPTVAPTATAATSAMAQPTSNATAAPAASTVSAGTVTTVAPRPPTTVAAAGPIGMIPPPAPGRFKGQKLSIVSKIEYFAESQKIFDTQIEDWGKLVGATIENTHVNQNMGNFLAKQEAAVKAGTVEDMAYLGSFVSQLRQLDLIVDVSDVVEELQKIYGPVEDNAKNSLFIEGKWWGIPYYANSNTLFVRKDWLDEKGIKLSQIKTEVDMRDVALEISDPARKRYGYGHTWGRNGDGNHRIEAVLNAYGGAIVSNDGKKVVFNSPETVEAITFLADIFGNPKYAKMIPPGVEGWTDTGNNEAWLNGTAGFVENAYTLYAQSYRDKNPIYGNTAVISGVLGPATDRVIVTGGWGAFSIFKGAKNPELAKETAKQMVGGAALLSFAKPSLGLILPTYKKQWDSDPFYTSGDPAFPALREIIQQEFPIKSKTGYAFPQAPSAGYDSVKSQFLMPDMMSDILLKKVKVADAVKETHDRMVKVFDQFGLKQ